MLKSKKHIYVTVLWINMLGRHHLLLSLFTVAFLFVPYFEKYSELTLFVLIGVAIGSLIPDADSPDAAIFHEKIHVGGNVGAVINNVVSPLFPAFGYITKYAIYKPSVYIFGATFLKKYNVVERHRGFLHSFFGIATSTVFTAVYLLILLKLVNLLNWRYFLIFMLSYSFGALMHLIEDSATVTGTQYNYPFSNFIVKGKLITRSDSARMPEYFTRYLGFVVVALLFVMKLGYLSYSNWFISLLSIIFLLLSWVIFMFLVAGARTERGELKSCPNVKSYF